MVKFFTQLSFTVLLLVVLSFLFEEVIYDEEIM